MILNLSKIKTEALLLFCKDLILSYKDKDVKLFNIEEELNNYINSISDDILKQINNVTFDTEHYLKNRKHYRIKAVLMAYNYINDQISKYLSQGSAFNPAMLFLALLAVWFKELDKERTSKEFIYFTLFPYGNVYDKLLINLKDNDFKKINIEMMDIAERTILNLDKVSFK